MLWTARILRLLGLVLLVTGEVLAQEASDSGAIPTVEEITARLRGSVVTIKAGGGSGRGEGIGSGFVVSADGLVATNHHVIGTGRRVKVIFDGGEEYDAVAVHASDRKFDLAVVRIESAPDHDLMPLEMGDASALEQGGTVLAFGNPQGFRFSVVSGVVSAWREVEGREMMQLAIPVEQGNSGGPVVDQWGRVHGILTMKSAITNNLGFAVKAADLERLLEAPNPVAMDDWLHIGQLDEARWTTVMGGRWSERGGVVKVEGAGTGFGGRALCLANDQPQEDVYEVALDVRLDNEAGAAGIAFCADGGDLHYGFYPTGGQLRLTRFNGPVVYSWTILEQGEHSAYREGDWNRLRVRIEPERIQCFVNNVLAFDSPDAGLVREGQVGFCKFRGTEAEFRGFRVGKNLARPVNADLEKRIASKARLLQLNDTERPAELSNLVVPLSQEPDAGAALLEDRIRILQESVEELQGLQQQARHRQVARELIAELNKPEPSLARAALLVAKLDHPDLDVEAYDQEIEQMVAGVRELIGEDGDALPILGKFLFEKQGFHGSRFDYHNPSNSHLNSVIDDREGLPITLSILFIEIAERLGIEGVHGLPLPTHFMVGHRPEGGRLRIIDAFAGGAILSRIEAEELVAANTGVYPEPKHFRPARTRDIVQRVIRNLVNVNLDTDRPIEALPYLDLILAIIPNSHPERFSRAFLRYRADDQDGARQDIETLLEARPEGMDLRQLRSLLERM